VIPSDESFTQFPIAGRVYGWRTLEAANNPECLVPTMKYEGGFVIV
jgi:hypothetical protein